ncbi:S41 family peptidase [Luteimonas yindakuii]|uniref:S41 family peptidase n=1 Tax=Luteimonas yindakuii TaxID=2565782 RepID=UPI0011076C30|nr:S41 family peptidase [Luteimonas yindakuii]QCU72338.1 S41 family peptidase [Luteimonas yindakuii]
MRVRLLPLLIAGLLSAPLLAQTPPVEPPATPVPAAQPATGVPPTHDAPAETLPAAEGGAAPADHGQDQGPPAADPAAAPADEREMARAVPAADDPDAGTQPSRRVPLDEIKRYVAVYNAVREAYVDPVDDAELMQSAIRGLLFDLDPHSAYLDAEDADAFDESTTGAYSGIGVEVIQLPDGGLRVVAPIDGTPAARAGLRSGDAIVAVDGVPLTPANHEGQGPLRGTPGTSITLTVMREGEAAPLEIPVERETIRVVSVRSRMLEPGYGYIRVGAFQVDTAAEFQRHLKELQAGGALRGLVLDLRSNPGGLLTGAVQIADDLLDSGQIVSTRGRIPISDAVFNATPGDLLAGAPIVVIVDAGSASASEVLAGALRDNDRARIVGSRTFGKGSVQTLLPLDNGDSVKLTTARYYTPSGRSIQARGIDPDRELQPDGGDAPVRNGWSEAALPGHLRGDEEEGLAGDSAGAVLEGDGPIAAALAELKQPGAAATSAAAPGVTDDGATPAPALDDGATPVPPASEPAPAPDDGEPGAAAPAPSEPAIEPAAAEQDDD